MPIKTFRGLIADLTTDTVVLHTNDGSIGYRIVNFKIMTNNPGADQDVEHIVKIYKVPQTGIPDGEVDFSDNTLLAAGFYSGDISHEIGFDQTIFFDNDIFNQDIYITHKDMQTDAACNYYIELEQVKLDLTENTVATLKDIRNVTSGL